jgi:hypothetical protein
MTLLDASPVLEVTDQSNVVKAVKNYLRGTGWEILSRTNTYTKERGVDLYASKDSVNSLVEAKGYPSASYRDPKRAGERKPTNSTSQAQHCVTWEEISGIIGANDSSSKVEQNGRIGTR